MMYVRFLTKTYQNVCYMNNSNNCITPKRTNYKSIKKKTILLFQCLVLQIVQNPKMYRNV